MPFSNIYLFFTSSPAHLTKSSCSSHLLSCFDLCLCLLHLHLTLPPSYGARECLSPISIFSSLALLLISPNHRAPRTCSRASTCHLLLLVMLHTSYCEATHKYSFSFFLLVLPSPSPSLLFTCCPSDHPIHLHLSTSTYLHKRSSSHLLSCFDLCLCLLHLHLTLPPSYGARECLSPISIFSSLALLLISPNHRAPRTCSRALTCASAFFIFISRYLLLTVLANAFLQYLSFLH